MSKIEKRNSFERKALPKLKLNSTIGGKQKNKSAFLKGEGDNAECKSSLLR